MSLRILSSLAQRFALFVACVAVGGTASASAFLESAAQARVRAATFEVVMKKPEKDSLTYEKPLPLNLLPYSERNDKYLSVGTAFALGGNRYVTAAHVLDAGLKTQYGEPALRGPDGTVHAIDQVHKYASLQDFAVVSIKSDPATAALEVNREPRLDDIVFAVGNALGEGIVIRDGLFTSQTPEERDGRWKWIRFSAAASPGNSGGPLLDKTGRVIGVVLRKSENENLNYAAPISLILDAPDNVATLEGEGTYWLPVMDSKESGQTEGKVGLPKPYAVLAKEINAFWEGFYGKLHDDLLRKNADSIFPRGTGSQQLLHSAYVTNSLYMVCRKTDGTWDAFFPNKMENATLPDNGYVAYGELAGATFLKIRKSDGAPAAEFYADSKQYMDTILKAVSWKRSVGREDVRIVSLGKAREDSVYTDSFGRKWQLRFWDVEYQDSVVVSMALPVPDGYVAMSRSATTESVQDALEDLKAMTSFAYVSFGGTLRQWHDFMAVKDLLPKPFAAIHVDYDYQKSFHYRSPRLEFTFGPQLQKIEPDSLLSLNFSYFDDGDAVVWDVAGLSVAEKISGGQVVTVIRHSRPPSSLPQAYGSRWEKLTGREYPYNATLVENAGTSVIDAVYPYPAGGKGAADERFVYEVGYAKEGKGTQAEMDAALMQWVRGLTVREK